MESNIEKLVRMMLQRLEEHGSSAGVWDVRNWMLRQGFLAEDVADAMNQLVRIIMSGARNTVPVRKYGRPPRQYAPVEEAKLSAEARDAITRLEANEMISGLERELIIERLMQSDPDNEMEMLDYMLATLVGSRRNVETQNALISTLDGYWPTFH